MPSNCLECHGRKCRPPRGASRNIEGVADNGIAGDLRLLAIAEELEAKPVLRHEISGVTSPDHIVEEGAYSVAHEEIAFNDRLGCGLQHNPKERLPAFHAKTLSRMERPFEFMATAPAALW